MSDKKLQIVAFDVPFPADYGGAIDVFYRIKALHRLGYKITLHCFEYGRGEQTELNKYCEEVIYYKRKFFTALFSKEPFIVASRKVPQLLENLRKNDSPILFEGLHTCGYLDAVFCKNQLNFARIHNVEHDYYAELAKNSKGWRKLFFRLEAKKLKKFEPVLKHADHILTIQKNDLSHFKKYSENVHLLPASFPQIEMKFNSKTDPICLFHGNLSVVENENAVLWILKNVPFPKGVLFIIAGKNPSTNLKAVCAQLEIELVANPTEEQMTTLVQSARIHLLYTEQSTGLKLKLLNALSTSGHVLLNEKMIAGTNLKELCTVAKTGEEFSKKIAELITPPLSEEAFDLRKTVLLDQFDTEKNCRDLFERMK